MNNKICRERGFFDSLGFHALGGSYFYSRGYFFLINWYNISHNPLLLLCVSKCLIVIEGRFSPSEPYQLIVGWCDGKIEVYLTSHILLIWWIGLVNWTLRLEIRYMGITISMMEFLNCITRIKMLSHVYYYNKIY